MGILRLKVHCLFCRKKIVQVRSSCKNDDHPNRNAIRKSTQAADWKDRCATSLCQLLNIPREKCSQWFSRSGYCDFCYQLLLDIQFVQSCIERFRKRQKALGDKTEALLLANWKDMEQKQPNSSPRYAEAVQCIGRLLERRDLAPPTPKKHNTSPLSTPAPARRRPKSRNVIKLKPMQRILSPDEDEDVGVDNSTNSELDNGGNLGVDIGGDTQVDNGGGLGNDVPFIDLGSSDSEDLFDGESGSLPKQPEPIHSENRRLTRGMTQTKPLPSLEKVHPTNEGDGAQQQPARKKRKGVVVVVRNPRPAKGSKCIRKKELAGTRLSCIRAFCKFTCLRKDELNGHVLGVHEGDPNPFHCPSCDEHFVALRQLDLHAAKTHGVSDHTLKCPHCPRIFNNRENMRSHLKNVHFDAKYKRCGICKKILNSEGEKMTHEALHDTSADPINFPCVLCDNTFSFQLELQDHVQLRHEDEYRIYECVSCALKFFTKGQKQCHEQRNHKERNPALFCKIPGCSYYGLTPAILKGHVLRRHQKGAPLKCTWPNCFRHLSDARCLKTHLLRHQLDQSPSDANFKCPTCSRGFHIKTSYLTHLRFHREERPFICDQCPNGYKSAANLFTHRQLKHGSSESDKDTSITERGKVSDSRRTKRDNQGDDGERTNENDYPDRNCAICESTKIVDQVGGVDACVACRKFFCLHLQKRYDGTCLESGSCPITLATRTHCRPCRLQKCYAVGLKKEDFERSRPLFPRVSKCHQLNRGIRIPNVQRPTVQKRYFPMTFRSGGEDEPKCVVCASSRSPTGEAFGASPCCRNCGVFFRDAVQMKRTYSCRLGGGCDDVSFRNSNPSYYCSSCRFQKCLAVGMKVEAVGEKPVPTVTGTCKICNQTSELLPVYGTTACRSCRYLFWTTIKHKIPRICRANGNCNEIGTECPACRFKKCLEVGMKPERLAERTKGRRTVQIPNTKEQKCTICGDLAKHKYSGGSACGACYLFFSKSDRQVRSEVGECKVSGSCVIDMLTRIDCPPCRLEKCVGIGMRRAKQWSKRRARTFGSSDLCLVCGEGARGMYYGVLSCYSCMYFFMKADRRGIGHCPEGGSCDVRQGKQNKCHSCRLTKCLAVGMKKIRDLRKRNGKIGRNSAEAAAIRAKIIQGGETILPMPMETPEPAGAPVEVCTSGSSYPSLGFVNQF